MFKKTLLFFFSLFLFVSSYISYTVPSAYAVGEPWSKEVNRSNPEDLSIRLVTFGPGDMIAEKFGHTALWVHDRRLKYERLYNFGMFHFNSDLLPQFLSGRLEFWVGADVVDATFRAYSSANRDILTDELNISPENTLKLAQELAEVTLPENRYYLYDHYYDNCSTRVRDAINTSTNGALFLNSQNITGKTLRDYTTIYTQSNPFVYFALMFWMNDEIDHPIDQWDAMFLPLELHRGVETAKYQDGEPIISSSDAVYRSVARPPTMTTPRMMWPYFLLSSLVYLLAVALVVLWYQSTQGFFPRAFLAMLQGIYGLAFGVLGTVLSLFPLTEHSVTHENINLLLANPVTLLLFILSFGILFNSKTAFRISQYAWAFLAGTSLICLAASPFLLQDSSVPIAMLLPLNLGFAVTFWLVERSK